MIVCFQNGLQDQDSGLGGVLMKAVSMVMRDFGSILLIGEFISQVSCILLGYKTIVFERWLVNKIEENVLTR
jgi:hypothetical protein